ncbi:PREDICTED: uncharacterized protein LOC107185282 [Dufourea novaeangliae]|uniref:Uncharacterized protein n=1 Tax=Dufourea novaeangliae TaxID=178035 RepID=A0A154P776_DUFNO|nr:PREDICTED: uncharacterized protein LOC107185282 [Dufourea novaeangliae]KZC07048.1 hypothetical protein WN55_08932 [Dufourea novaeangliae]
MDNDLKISDIKVGANELLAFQRDLKQEKEFLVKLLTKIDSQVHRLQVEQLHLLGMMNKSMKESEEKSPSHESNHETEQDTSNKSLDLSIASALKYFQEEEEDEDM